MHMADALLSPAVGGIMWIAASGTLAYSSRKLSRGESLDEESAIEFRKKIPLMGVMGALVFASQMINFTIPGTGSSGHIGGGLLLAALLGPEAGFVTIASVLAIQALFFADGGLLALGCNIMNLGVFACFISFSFIYRKLLRNGFSRTKIMIASIVSVVVALQLGSLGVVLETSISKITELPFSTFVLMMQPIHLAIGLVEGILTGAVLIFIYEVRPELLEGYNGQDKEGKLSIKLVVITLMVCTLLIGGGLSMFASSHPDGLEWSIEKVTGSNEIDRTTSLGNSLSSLQEKTAFLPDYSLKTDNENPMGTTVSGIIGSMITLGIVGVIGFIFKCRKENKEKLKI